MKNSLELNKADTGRRTILSDGAARNLGQKGEQTSGIRRLQGRKGIYSDKGLPHGCGYGTSLKRGDPLGP